MSRSVFDSNHLKDLTFGSDWGKYVAAPWSYNTDNPVEGFKGLSMLVLQPFAQNLSNVLQDDMLGAEASKLRIRFASDLLLPSIMEADVPALEGVAGESTRANRRVLVITEVGITLSVLFSPLACCFLAMIWCASTSWRPLNLRSDSATTVATISLLDISRCRVARPGTA
jgi:hypothetical protein